MNQETFIIKGLAGEKSLKGAVHINGAKNSVLKAQAASILFADPLIIKNMPDTADVRKLSDMLIKAGAKISCDKSEKSATFDTSEMTSVIDQELAVSMRGSVMLTGPMLARFGKVSFPAPGGCVIGARPINLFLSGYESMGATVELVDCNYVITAPAGGLKAAEIFFPIQTVGGTETLMMAAVLANGTTVLKNCAMEPEIQNLAEYLVSCGAKIKGIGTTTLEIVGAGPKGLLHSKGKAFVTIPDRIEAGSFLFLGAVCAEELMVADCEPKHLEAVTSLLKESGVKLEIGKDFVKIVDNKKINLKDLKGASVRTHEYPGFPTDVQAPLVAFLTQVGGESEVFETIYEGRFKYTQDLVRMGASIETLNSREIKIAGSASYTALAEPIQAFDIRAGFATVIAALSAKGTSTVTNVHLIDRGYEALEGRLKALGADIQRVSK